MKEFLLAIQFLTIIPVHLKNVTQKKIAASMIFFPAAGLLIGLLLAGINLLLSSFPAGASSAILVVSLIIVTGGMHLDGLSDTFDAISSAKNREEMLRIMKEPQVGAMGVISMLCVLLLKVSFLASLNTQLRPPALILMTVLSRWSLVGAIFAFPYARQEGKAKVFLEGINGKIFIMATISTVVIAAFVWSLKGLAVMAAAGITAWCFAKIMAKKLGGITGDILGAANEITEIITLLLVVLLTKTQ